MPTQELAHLTGYTLTRGVLCAMRRPQLPDAEAVCAGARRVAVLEARWFRPELVLISDALGVMKPGPEIFRIAEQAAGARAEDCVYVGDSYSQDVAGAGGCGWETVWLNRRGDAAGELAPTYCVKTEEDLLAYLKRMA